MKARIHRAIFGDYAPLPNSFDELYKVGGEPRETCSRIVTLLDQMGHAELRNRQRLAAKALLTGGITFSVYSNQRGTERIFPFDVIPRVIAAADWKRVERGLKQRVSALNLFLADIYGAQRCIQEGIVPRSVVETSSGFLPQMMGVTPNGGQYVHISGIDLIRDDAGEFIVLEDNVRTPSGVSYVLENRSVMKRVLAPVLSKVKVRSVDRYPAKLREALMSVGPQGVDRPRVAVLTPGPFNSAYFEHSYLARRMGCDLAHPSDLFTQDGRVFIKTTAGPRQIDVLYKRVDDAFLDPTVFRKDSLLGVPGLIDVYAKGRVTLANAPGNGVADDKTMYPFIPDIIRFFMSEEPILGQVDTLMCVREEDRKRVLANLSEMVVKQVDASGGYGMLMGHQASKAELTEFAAKIKEQPRRYIAQPLISLSTCPTWTRHGAAPRRIDLRPFVVSGQSQWVLPGGLTRVALEEGSYVVNSSQGGGSKDTWVLKGEAS